jgi:hypothetical protein
MRAMNTKQIKDAITLDELIRHDCPDLTHNLPGKNMYALCPFHKEKTPSLCVSNKKNKFYCFGCGVSGDHYDWLYHKLGYFDPWVKGTSNKYAFNAIFPELVRKLSQITGVKIKKQH